MPKRLLDTIEIDRVNKPRLHQQVSLFSEISLILPLESEDSLTITVTKDQLEALIGLRNMLETWRDIDEPPE